MTGEPPQPLGRKSALASLNVAIKALRIAKGILTTTTVTVSFDLAIGALSMVEVGFWVFCEDGL